MTAEEIRHPESGASIKGTRLVPGERIQDGDMYDSNDGNWRADKNFVGRLIEPSCGATWVRPEQ